MTDKTSIELLAESIALLKASERRAAEEQRAPLKQALQSAEQKLAAAQKTADTLGLREALAFVIDHLRPYHAWIHKHDRHRTPGIGVEILDATLNNVGSSDYHYVLLTVEGRRYVLQWQRVPGHLTGLPHGDATFETDTFEILFGLDYGTKRHDDFEMIVPGTVTKLALGVWVHDLIRLSERLRAGQELRNMDTMAKLRATQAQGI